MLQSGCTAVLQAGSREDFRSEVVRFSQQLGFSFVSAMSVLDVTVGRSEFVRVDNAPAGFSEVMNNVPAMRLDPVMQHCRKHTWPIVWNQDTYTREGLGELWEEQASFGYRTGIAMALHLPEGRHFALGVERDQALPANDGEVTRLVADDGGLNRVRDRPDRRGGRRDADRGPGEHRRCGGQGNGQEYSQQRQAGANRPRPLIPARSFTWFSDPSVSRA